MKFNYLGFACNGLLLRLLAGLLLLVLILLSGCQPSDAPPPMAPGTIESPDVSIVTVDERDNGAEASPDIPVITTEDLDNDGITDLIEDQLIQRFAPIVRLHSDEQYLPANIPWYLSRVRMRFEIAYRPDKQFLEAGSVNMQNLISQTYDDQTSGFTRDPTNFFLEQTDISGGDSLDKYREETRMGTKPTDWICYAHVRSAPTNIYPEMYDVQYIFFYAYNGDMALGPVESAHEADFEHITVRVEDEFNTIYQIYYSAHDDEGRWYDQQIFAESESGYSLNEDGRPIVYSAIDSHASYPWAGRWDRRSVELPADVTNDGGFEWDCLQGVVNLGEKHYPRESMEWIQYSGRWGEIGEMSWTTGPYGPAYQIWWSFDLE